MSSGEEGLEVPGLGYVQLQLLFVFDDSVNTSFSQYVYLHPGTAINLL